jgi:mono/diheme cytochrome c family protein
LKKPALIVFAILAVVGSLAAQAPRPAAPNPAEVAAQAAAVERGRVIFKENCSACHAEDATGGRGPDLIRSSLVRHDKGGDLIGTVVTGGRADKGMPPFPMTQSQISDIVAFLNAQISLFDLHTAIRPRAILPASPRNTILPISRFVFSIPQARLLLPW